MFKLEGTELIYATAGGGAQDFCLIPWPFFVVDGGEECLLDAGTIFEVAIMWKLHMMRMH